MQPFNNISPKIKAEKVLIGHWGSDSIRLWYWPRPPVSHLTLSKQEMAKPL